MRSNNHLLFNWERCILNNFVKSLVPTNDSILIVNLSVLCVYYAGLRLCYAGRKDINALQSETATIVACICLRGNETKTPLIFVLFMAIQIIGWDFVYRYIAGSGHCTDGRSPYFKRDASVYYMAHFDRGNCTGISS